ncbi:MAG TPA: PqqD family protein [Gemmatimonadales bacterium]
MTTDASHPAGITLATRVAASERQVSCDLAEEVVVLSLEDGAYYGMNVVAARVWQLVHTPCTVGAVCETLLEEFEGVTAEECEREVVAFVGRLVGWGLVTVEGSTAR